MIFDFFKKKKKPPAVTKALAGKEKKEELKTAVKRPKKKISETAWRVLYSPHITEKATFLEKENKYVFKVLPKANKSEIKKTIELLHGVNVVGVKIINIPRRRRRLGRQMGWKKGYKKAIVKIKEGQKIEVLPR